MLYFCIHMDRWSKVEGENWNKSSYNKYFKIRDLTSEVDISCFIWIWAVQHLRRERGERLVSMVLSMWGTLGHSFAPASWCWSDWQKTLGQSCSKQLALCIWNMRVITYPLNGTNNYTYLNKSKWWFAHAQSHVLYFWPSSVWWLCTLNLCSMTWNFGSVASSAS